jgi:arylsulfatase A-like enzyme
LVFVSGLFAGVTVGLVRGWKYISKGLLLFTVDTLQLSVNESIFIALLFLLLYLLMFLAFRRLIKNVKWASFIASTLSCLPFILFWGYRINKENYVYLSTLFEWRSVILNLKIGLGFIVLWLLVSIGLFLWTRSRILKAKTVSMKPLGLLLGLIIILNVPTYLFKNPSTVKRDSPNVIILLVDCLRADHLSSYGYSRNTTPNIDRFSKDSVLFTQAISQATFTKMSIASLFTSLYPYQHGVYRGAGDSVNAQTGDVTTDVLGEEETTLAEVLSQNGFMTVGWVSVRHLVSYLGFAQGFIDYHEGGYRNKIKNINKEFTEWAKRIGRKHEFFAYIHYIDLHSPYKPKPPYDTLYLSDGGKDEGKSKRERRAYIQRALYDGQLTYIDSQIGVLLDELKKTGLYDNTLIVLTGDHGDAFGEHGFFTHSRAPYEELIRVPLIVKFPKSMYAGRVVKNQVRLIDVMPTILDFLKIKTDVKLSGFSLLNYLDNRGDVNHEVDFPKYAISEIYNQKEGMDAISIRTEQFKYIHFKNKGDELYDLRKDPAEKNNIIDQEPLVAEEFRKMLPPILAEKNQKRVKKVTLDKETVKELKALGYIQ